MQREIESQWQTARLETKRYDEVLEAYRANLYGLRRLVLTGGAPQRTQVCVVIACVCRSVFFVVWSPAALLCAVYSPLN